MLWSRADESQVRTVKDEYWAPLVPTSPLAHAALTCQVGFHPAPNWGNSMKIPWHGPLIQTPREATPSAVHSIRYEQVPLALPGALIFARGTDLVIPWLVHQPRVR